VSVERELKFPVADLEALRSKLASLGAVLVAPASLERNWVLDDPGQRLRRQGLLLRVRQWRGQGSLTFKGPASFAAGVKSREELETTVGDAEKVLAILAAVGFGVAFYYEKHREVWSWGAVTVDLDHTPMGDFLELEGEGRALGELCRKLGFAPEQALRGSYLELWHAFRQRHPEAPEHMVFRW
jgi:adenylate cyclase class 2